MFNTVSEGMTIFVFFFSFLDFSSKIVFKQKISSLNQCHINWPRKPAYQFSWDWGPSLPDSGLYSAPIIYNLPKWTVLSSALHLVSKYSDLNQIVKADFYIQTNQIEFPVFDDVELQLDDIKMTPQFRFSTYFNPNFKNGFKNVLILVSKMFLF